MEKKISPDLKLGSLVDDLQMDTKTEYPQPEELSG